MTRWKLFAAILAAITVAGSGYLVGQQHGGGSVLSTYAAVKSESSVATGPILYYRDPDRPYYSLEPKRSEDGRDYIPVRAGEDVSFDDKAARAVAGKGSGKILYYRNPMGLPDVSPVPKKDSMGMDYIPVYEGEDQDDTSIKISPGKIQKTGVQSEPAERRVLTETLRLPGTVQLDERRQAVIALRFDAWIETVANVTTGDHVKKGQPLMRIYGPAFSGDAAQYLSALGWVKEAAPGTSAKGARQRLENLAIPETVLTEIERTRQVPLTITWPAPRDGIILQRNAVDGMRAPAGEVLFRITDLSVVWILADVSERDLPLISIGRKAIVKPRGYPERAFSGEIKLIYPQINRETRTARIRIELENPQEILRPDMYADIEIATGAEMPVLSVAEGAVLDSGTRQIVIIDRGEGRFEPREVKLGQRGDGYVEIREGIDDNDWVVVKANFLIDAESNLKAALRGLVEKDRP